MPSSPARAVIFDLFHTLVDTEHFKPPGFDYRARIVELADLDDGDFRAYWADRYLERETTLVDHGDLVDRYLAGLGRPPLDPDQRLEVDRLLGIGKDDALRRPRPEMVDLVADVAERVPIGVLSNCHGRETRCWPRSPLAPLAGAFVRSCDIGVMKPDPAAYRAVVAGIGVPPSASVYVGNGGGDELAGARRAGFSAIVHTNAFDRSNGLVTPEEQRRRAGQADVSVESIGELRAELTARLDPGPGVRPTDRAVED